MAFLCIFQIAPFIVLYRGCRAGILLGDGCHGLCLTGWHIAGDGRKTTPTRRSGNPCPNGDDAPTYDCLLLDVGYREKRKDPQQGQMM